MQESPFNASNVKQTAARQYLILECSVYTSVIKRMAKLVSYNHHNAAVVERPACHNHQQAPVG